MVKQADFDKRGWSVLPSFNGAGLLKAGIFEQMQDHPLLPGESAWGTRNILHALILSTRPKTVVEIGSHIGSASVVIGSALKANGFGHAYHLEPQDHYFSILKDFLNKSEVENFSTPLQIFSTDDSLVDIVGDDVDLIFLDANHSYTNAAKDIEICVKILSDKGFILLDDVGFPHSGNICSEGKGGVRQAVLDFVSRNEDYSLTLFEPPFWLNPCGLGILTKKPIA